MNSVPLPIDRARIAEEIIQVRALTAFLRTDFTAWEKGVADRYRIMTDLFLTEHYLAKYLHILEATATAAIPPEPAPRRNNIYLLPTSGGKNHQRRTK